MSEAPTIDEVIAYVETLDPKLARTLQNGAMEAACATPEITRIVDNAGRVHHLKRKGGKIAVGYVRVSTYRQKSDGWSIKDQVRRLVEWFISKGWAFRIVSDASLSGGAPPDDPALIAAVGKLKRERYAKVFARNFLADYITTYTPAQKDTLRKYLDERLKEMKRGVGDLEDRISQPDDTPDDTPTKPKWRGGEPKRDIRPGVTVVRNWYKITHCIAITDRTRLSRSAALAVKLAEEIDEYGIALVGVIEPLGRGDSDGDDIAQAVMGAVAEATLTAVCGNAIRGIDQMLQNGLPHGSLPFWCTRITNDSGKTVRIEENPLGMATIRALIKMALDGDETGQEMGASKLLVALMAGVERGEYIAPSDFNEKRKSGGKWILQSVKRFLNVCPTNPDDSPNEDGKNMAALLRGKQLIFGLERSVLPEVIDDYTLGRLQERQTRRKEELGGRPPANLDNWYLGKGLFRCWCGNKLQANINRNQYSCPDSLIPGLRRERKHLVLNMPDVDRFLNDLLRCAPLDLIETVTGVDESETLRAQWLEARDAYDALKAQRQADEANAQQNAHSVLQSAKILPDNPLYAASIKNLTDAALVGIDAQLAAAKRVFDERQQACDNYAPPVGYTDYAEQLARLETMTNEDKNRLLTRLFRPFECEGDAPHQALHVVRLSADSRELPSIVLKCRDMGAGNWERRMPGAAAWYAQVKRYLSEPVTHVRNSTTGQRALWGEVDVRNFQLDTNPRPETDSDKATGEPVTDTSATVTPWTDDDIK
ncbi:MAG: hypothetical protein JWL77_3673 [Chthonomonadaceae bacterium]|nr:hypothetical protein [Chthonomonadaceae bacterium]